MSYGTTIKQLREERGWTPGDLVQRAGGIGKQSLSQWENEVHAPSAAMLGKLACAFGVPVGTFFGECNAACEQVEG